MGCRIERWLVAMIVVLSACGSDPPDGSCTDGETRSCYDGPPGTEGVGGCTAGIETCVNGEFPGVCIGDVVPFVEQCDGIDEDCNGTIDDVDGFGAACTKDGCDGAKQCVGAVLGCVAPERNACDVCDGVVVTDVGGDCAVGNCSGQLLCNSEGTGTECNAPAENACGVCGGPVIQGLGDDCTATAGCSGIKVCSNDGESAVCDCEPEPGSCRGTDGVFRPVVAPVVGDLIITEVMPSPAGDDTLQEWFEVEVTAAVDLNGLALDRVDDTRNPDVLLDVDCIRVAPGDRLVFARSADAAENDGLPPVTGTFGFSLVAGSVAAPADVRILFGGAVIDALTWTTSSTSKALQLDLGTIDEVANDTETNLCNATTGYGTSTNLGTPGTVNRVCPPLPGECLGANGFRRQIVKPAAGQLVISELFANPFGTGTDADQEWFEITNVGPGSFDLNDLGLKGNATTVNLITSQPCLPLAKDGFAVFAHTTDSQVNGGLAAVVATFTFAIAASNGSLSVLDGTTPLDVTTWTTPAVPDGVSRQLDPTKTTSTDNDLQANFCDAGASQTYGPVAGNVGTPGAPNVCL